MSSKQKLFTEPKYTRQPGFVILVRDYKLYKQGDSSMYSYFVGFSSPSTNISFDKVNFATDKIFVLPTEETMCEYVLGGKCLNQFKYNPAKVDANVETILQVLENKKFVGYINSNYSGDKAKIRTSFDGRGITFQFKQLDGATWDRAENSLIAKNADKFFMFDTEYDLWNWIIKGD